MDKAGAVVRKVTGERRSRVARDGDAAWWEGRARSICDELRDIYRNETTRPDLRIEAARLAASLAMQGRDAAMDQELLRLEAER